ncbi:MAG: ABC transporter substrate-binding protein, partial [Caldivirga sp.]|uniref:ABC transporter substrate-binding protein n=1 Tax=Caldivirga sp. TaxID=2080243 RepID=UPI003D103C3F
MKLARKLIVLASLTILIVTMIIALPQQAQKPQIIWADYGSLVLTGPIYNPFYPNTLASDSVTSIMTYAPLALYNPFNNQFYPVLARNWSIQLLPNGSGILTIYLRHGLYWFNGSATIPFTAWDVYAYFYIYVKAFQMYYPYMLPQYADEDIRVINNYTIQFLLNTYSPYQVVYILDQVISTPWSVWKPIVNKLKIMNITQAEAYSTNITDFVPPCWYIGQYYLTYLSSNARTITLIPSSMLSIWYDVYPLASWAYYQPSITTLWLGTIPGAVAALLSGKAFVTGHWIGFSEKQLEILNSSGFGSYLIPDFSSWGLFLNPWVYPFNIPKVRQAFCYVFNRTAIAAAWGLNIPDYYPEPTPSYTVNTYPPDLRKFLIPYSYNLTKAAEL